MQENENIAGPPQGLIRQFGNYRPYQEAHFVVRVAHSGGTFVQDFRLSSNWRAKKQNWVQMWLP